MTDVLVAEDGIPIPPEPESKRRSPYTDAVAALAPGQSVLIPRPLQTGLSAALWATARAGLTPADAKLRYSVRAVEGGCRVWRNKRPEGYHPPLDPPREDA